MKSLMHWKFMYNGDNCHFIGTETFKSWNSPEQPKDCFWFHISHPIYFITRGSPCQEKIKLWHYYKINSDINVLQFYFFLTRRVSSYRISQMREVESKATFGLHRGEFHELKVSVPIEWLWQPLYMNFHCIRLFIIGSSTDPHKGFWM